VASNVVSLMTRRASSMTRGAMYTVAAAVGCVAMIAAIALAANWRLALLSALIAATIALTRLRYSPLVAVVVLATTLVLALTGHSAGSDDRDVPARPAHR
jgi:hypothetical protein